ncbi:hypothetical protein M9Y10_039752 [Tritrichomonas musculus]|uniref:HNH nuclease domain-containing protein n=1 Tax=Tritrichomonas musculus TaxID=1915356 RepID=A0ABR2GR77_9EUKA
MAQFVPLKGFEDQYEIQTTYPYNIRNKDTLNNNIGIYTKRDGIIIGLNGKRYRKHKLIAKQFLPGYSEPKPIYHKNGDKFDNHLDNLTYKRSDVNSNEQL